MQLPVLQSVVLILYDDGYGRPDDALLKLLLIGCCPAAHV